MILNQLKKHFIKLTTVSVMLLAALVNTSVTNASPGFTPVYRLYNNGSIQHLMTLDSNENSILLANRAWKAETATFKASASSNGNCSSGMVPVYRIVEKKSGEHLLTSDTNEVNFWTVTNNTWYLEGIGFCVYASQSAGTSPVYRLYNSQNGEHLLTADVNEVSNLNGRYNWSLEVNGNNGVAFYSEL